MRVFERLLLSSAGSLVAVTVGTTAGQAADLPVKARPVQYVKICSLYGAGFYYMPGTDMCLKIGGWVRAEVSYGVGRAGVQRPPEFEAVKDSREARNFPRVPERSRQNPCRGFGR